MKTTIMLPILIFTICIGYTDKKQNTIINIKNREIMEKQTKQNIETLLMNYKETLNNADAAQATSLYTKDGVFMANGAPSAIGAEQIKSTYEYFFSQIQLNIEFYIEEIVIENNIAFAITSSKGTILIHETGATIAEENRELFVLEKENNAWKIARYMFNKIK